jgi:hypothetical protein
MKHGFFFVLAIASVAVSAMAQQPLVGGYSTASVSKKEVVEAAQFAVHAQEQAMERQAGKGAKPVALTLEKIAGAEEQVVAGMNYKLQLWVKLNGRKRPAKAIVWWQAWRKPNPYQLVSWNWQ